MSLGLETTCFKHVVSIKQESLIRRGIMSINIKTNFGPTTKSLGDQGAFRNAMYHKDKDNKRENKKEVPKTPVKDQNSTQIVKNDEFRLLSAEIQGELTNVEEQMSIAQTAGNALIKVEKTLFEINELLLILSNRQGSRNKIRARLRTFNLES